MFDIARAALLEAGVAEDKLPRTHSGLIDAFRQHAVQTGKFDKDMSVWVACRSADFQLSVAVAMDWPARRRMRESIPPDRRRSSPD
jgi:uncharacterized protein (UPF0332 family)